MNANYDGFTVGARAAGSSLALLLARQGRRVLMVDRDVFPSDALSAHFVIPPAVGQLAALCVLDDVEAAGFAARADIGDVIEEAVNRAPAPAGGRMGGTRTSWCRDDGRPGAPG